MDDETSPYILYAKKNPSIFIVIGVMLIIIIILIIIISITPSKSAFSSKRSYMVVKPTKAHKHK